MTQQADDEFERAFIKAMTEPISETEETGYHWCRLVRHPTRDDGPT